MLTISGRSNVMPDVSERWPADGLRLVGSEELDPHFAGYFSDHITDLATAVCGIFKTVILHRANNVVQ